MKSLISALAALLLVEVPQSTKAASCACATGSLNVRSGAGTSNSILHTMTAGECLPYTGDSTQAGGLTWFHLHFHGQSAWAASNWLTVKACGASGSSVQLPGCPKIITRAEWGARPPSNAFGNMPDLPIYVFIHHGATAGCHDRESCITSVKSYQNYHMDTHGWPDIGYNFVVGEDGSAYEARGWRKIGAHTYGYNHNGIAICVVGDFTSRAPNDAALSTVRQLIQCGLDNGVISPTYTLKGHRDVGSTECPGASLYKLIQSWAHYAPGTALYRA